MSVLLRLEENWGLGQLRWLAAFSSITCRRWKSLRHTNEKKWKTVVSGITTKNALLRGEVISCRIRCPPSGSMLHCTLLFGEKSTYFCKKEMCLRCFSFPKGLLSRARGKYREVWLFLPLAIPPQGEDF